jgi:hypothetical protein
MSGSKTFSLVVPCIFMELTGSVTPLRSFRIEIDIFNLKAIYEMTGTDTRVRVRSKWQQFFELFLKRWAIIMKMSQLQVTNWTTDDPKHQASYQLDYVFTMLIKSKFNTYSSLLYLGWKRYR